MSRFIAKRILNIIPILLGVSFIVFSILSLTPGDPGSLILGPNAQPEAINQLNEQLGFNQPFFIRYLNYVADVIFRFDFGNSYRTGDPVMTEIIQKFPITFTVAFWSIIVASIIGVTAGIYSALKQYSLSDIMTTVTAMLLASIPNFWLGLMLILFFSLTLRWLPSNGIDTWRHFVLPTITIALPTSAGIIRLTRSTMLETIRQDYIRTARAKGAKELTVVFKHALKNALLPVITFMGTSLGWLLGGTVITETIYALPGLGTLLLTAIRSKDVPMVMAATLFISFFYCIVMIIVDVLYGVVDPRIKAKYKR